MYDQYGNEILPENSHMHQQQMQMAMQQQMHAQGYGQQNNMDEEAMAAAMYGDEIQEGAEDGDGQVSDPDYI